jgi:hypothetical protein
MSMANDPLVEINTAITKTRPINKALIKTFIVWYMTLPPLLSADYLYFTINKTPNSLNYYKATGKKIHMKKE